jgi:hypothetical protein
MGSPGHKFISHTKALSPAAQTKDGGFGSPPHPLVARPGQRFWPRKGRRCRPFVIRTVTDEAVFGVRLDGDRDPVRVTVRRLLATREDGQGDHYQFQGWVPRRYTTYARVIDVSEPIAVLCLPEWHPRRPVALFASLLPVGAKRQGAWLALRCDLSVPSAGRLQPSELRPTSDPGMEIVHRPALA